MMPSSQSQSEKSSQRNERKPKSEQQERASMKTNEPNPRVKTPDEYEDKELDNNQIGS